MKPPAEPVITKHLSLPRRTAEKLAGPQPPNIFGGPPHVVGKHIRGEGNSWWVIIGQASRFHREGDNPRSGQFLNVEIRLPVHQGEKAAALAEYRREEWRLQQLRFTPKQISKWMGEPPYLEADVGSVFWPPIAYKPRQ